MTLAQLKRDPRIARVWTERDGFTWDAQGRDAVSYWADLAPGYNCDGTTALHEASVSELCDSLNTRVCAGPGY